MIKGNKVKEFISVDEIMARTGGGYDIYMFYLGKVQKQMKRPWGKDTKPSWGIFPSDSGIWAWKDHATEETGNAVTFVERKFGLSTKDAKDKICWDFGISKEEPNPSPVKVNWERPEAEDIEEYSHISFSSQPFKKHHHDFWNCVEVSEDWCKQNECYAVKSAAINRQIIPIRRNEAVFAFYAPDINSVKLYFADRDKGNKFRNNVPYRYLWNFDNVKECDDLIIQKSNKDRIVTSLIFPCVINTQAEAVKIFNEEVVDKVNSITKTPWVWYGSDWDGVKKCKEITDTNKWKYINTPKQYLPDVNDTYSIVKMWNLENPGTGLKKLEEFMRLKKLLK